MAKNAELNARVLFQYNLSEPDRRVTTREWVVKLAKAHNIYPKLQELGPEEYFKKTGMSFATAIGGACLILRTSHNMADILLEQLKRPENNEPQFLVEAYFSHPTIVGSTRAIVHGPYFAVVEEHLRTAPGVNIPLNWIPENRADLLRQRAMLTREEFGRFD